MPDDIRALSATLAADPTSLVYADLAEALRRRGDIDQALRVVVGGLTRHPEHADGLDCLGRIHADRGDLVLAREAWSRALTLAPDHFGALKGMGFALFRDGDAQGAVAVLERAVAVRPGDEGARRALDVVLRMTGGVPAAPPPAPVSRAEPSSAPALAAAPPPAAAPAETPSPARAQPAAVPDDAATGDALPAVFRGFEGATADILLFDDRGLVVAGGLSGARGDDVAALAAAGLAGVSTEASRTAQYLSLGVWSAIVAEAERANLVLTPVSAGTLLLVRRDHSVSVGLTRRVAERAQTAAAAWLERQGA